MLLCKLKLWGPLLSVLLLSACGFKPLHQTDEQGKSIISHQLAATKIANIPDRTGQKMRNYLRVLLNPQGQSRHPQYYLEVSLKISKKKLAVRKNAFATRANMKLTVRYTLKDSTRKNILIRNNISVINSFDILDAQYASIIAEKEAVDRTLRQASKDIYNQLTIFFLHNRNNPLKAGNENLTAKN